MSVRLNRRYERWSELETSLPLAHRYKGQKLLEQDSATWNRCLICFGLLCEDLSLVPSWNRQRLIAYIATLAAMDVYDVVSALKDFGSALRDTWRAYRGPGAERLDDFKHRLGLDDPVVATVLRPALPLLTKWWECPDLEIQWFHKLYQFAEFLGRACLEGIPHDKLIEEFIAVDTALPDLADVNLDPLRRIIRRWLRDFSVENSTAFPHHSDGATSDGGNYVGGFFGRPTRSGKHSLAAKYFHAADDEMISYVVRRYAPRLVHYLRTWADPEFDGCYRLSRRSKASFVPKSSTKKRMIAMEESYRMYWQQCVKDALYDFFKVEKRIRRHITLEDQSVNASLAQAGSENGALATIDLSHASDSVSWELVKQLFRGTQLLPWLWATRAREIELEEKIVHLRKFATMGNAVTFPVETLVFAAICEEAQEEWQKCHRCSRLFTYSVYGDDIVVEWELVPHILRRLTELGFEPNMEKTFHGLGQNSFRESCGMECVGGIDVTPLRIPRKFSAKDFLRHPDGIGSYLRLANVALVQGYQGLRHYLIQKMMQLPSRYRPIFIDPPLGSAWRLRQFAKQSSGIWTWCRHSNLYQVTVAAAPHQRRVPDYQRLEIWGYGLKVAKAKGQPKRLEAIRYFEAMAAVERNPGIRRETSTYIGKVCRPELESSRLPYDAFITPFLDVEDYCDVIQRVALEPQVIYALSHCRWLRREGALA